MDKKARNTLKASKDQRNITPARSSTTEDQSAPQEIVVQDDPLENMDKDEVAALIRESLDEAERELNNRKTKRAANPDRQALIDQAMAIHRAKRHVVDELPAEQREKLMFMALKTLGNADDSDGNR